MSDIEQLNQSYTEEEVDQPVPKNRHQPIEEDMTEEDEQLNEPEELEEEDVPMVNLIKNKSKKAESPKLSKAKKAEAAKRLLGFEVDQEEQDQEEQSKKSKSKIIDDDDEIIEDEEPAPKSKKTTKPKGKYDDMTLKQLQALTKERKVNGRSGLKTRDAIISRLEQLDSEPEVEDDENAKPANKYQTMTISELKKLMGERNISGRSTIKTKDAMIEKLLAFDENPEEMSSQPKEKASKGLGKGLGKGGASRHKKTESEEEDPQDEEVNKKVAELVNKLYKIKKHAKKQSPEFKTGFMDYINDLHALVCDYQESCQ